MCHFKIIFLVFIVIFFSCNKNEAYDVPVKGNVRNNCTGLPFSGQNVGFSYENKSYSTKTDAGGNFDFGAISVHPNDQFEYNLGVPGYSNYDYELYGTSVLLNKNELADFHQFGISASFKVLHLTFPSTYVFNPNDSVDLRFNQRTLKQYEPGRITTFSFKGQAKAGNYPGFTNYFSNIDGYPMGWWNINLTKFKSGIYSTLHDSIFIDMGATATYTIPW